MAESGNTSSRGSDQSAAAGNARGLDGLQALVERAGKRERGAAPVEKWEPDHRGEIDIEIRRDGRWFHEGTPIERQALVDLFATVLRKDGDGHTYLVTPVEKLRIRVEDAPFLAVEMNASERDGEEVLTFRTNVGDVIEAGEEHPLRFEHGAEDGAFKPYLLVRGRLEALLTRAVTHELVGRAQEIEVNGGEVLAVSSGGAVFALMEAREEPAGVGGGNAGRGDACNE